MKNEDIRWIQRFDNYQKALKRLNEAVLLTKKRPLSDLEKQGFIQAFEFTHELAWKTLKDFLLEKGNKEIYGSKDAVREAFGYGLIKDGEIWMEMISSRNKTSHTYNEETAEMIVQAIISSYFDAFVQLSEKLSGLKDQK